MAEKLSSSSAGAVIAGALARARAEGTRQIGEEHLFAALLGHPASRPLFGLAGPEEEEAVCGEVRAVRRRAGITASEQAALAGLGIDVDGIVARVEAQLGEGALDSGRVPYRRGWPVSMTPGARAVVNGAQKQKAARGDRGLTAQHLALSLLATPGPFSDVLRARGVTVASALAALDGEVPPAAAG